VLVEQSRQSNIQNEIGEDAREVTAGVERGGEGPPAKGTTATFRGSETRDERERGAPSHRPWSDESCETL
jgi:hypothetical protein